jgi:siroheme synthase-like protein
MESSLKTVNGEERQFMPVCIDIACKRIVLVGGGKVACHKATLLNRFTDRITLVAPAFCPELEALPFELKRKEYGPADLEGAFLVYICTENESLNAAIKAECEKRGILASVCDNPALCDFISPAVYKDGNLTIAVSSNAQDVRRSVDIRDRIKALVESGVIKRK